ncbi:Ras GTPase activating protein ira2 [Metarhizium rileyi]|uniref:Ras GTPase activating protein ira2 n=1 Tax=Metarhizium rileyi (strain RCEF 4871) TaxID=1649241 RepID=A0A5C6GDL8_METRR|nr:Ras GTPase activating protein ira2 [Metarhizium rileyi]
MNSDSILVGCLVDRIASRLPYHSGSTGRTCYEDDILKISRATLVDLSRNAIAVVLESLLRLLEDLARPFSCVTAHPPHVLQSELYIVSLAADSCTANWKSEDDSGLNNRLGKSLVSRVFDVLNQLLEPIPDDYILPAQTLLDHVPERNFGGVPHIDGMFAQNADEAECLVECLKEFDTHIKVVVEYVSALSWSAAFDYVRNTIYSIRTTTFCEAGLSNQVQTQDVDTPALVTLRLLSFFQVDSTRLGHIVQEICSSYLHFRKSYQRLDGGGDTLFDMTQTGIDNGRQRAVLYPLQITLLLLLPDVFEVASNLREAKSNNLIKKVSFLDNLRKALRNGNERAAYCLVSLLRAARHFEAESDSALVSYAMDVQDEIRESVFSMSQFSVATPQFDQDMITAAFVSLAHLGLDSSVETLTKTCTSPHAPDSFKIAAIRACSYFARQSQTAKYSGLYASVLPLIRSEFESECINSLEVRSEQSNDSDHKILQILWYLDVSPDSLLWELSGETKGIAFLKPLLFCVLSRDQSIRRLATKIANRLFTIIKDSVGVLRPGELGENLWGRSSSIILELCGEIEKNISLSNITQLHEFLSARLALLKGMPFFSHLPIDVLGIHLAASKLETTLLIAICSPDVAVCQLATLCIGLLVDECDHVGEYSDSAKMLSSTYRNQLVYQELSSPAFRFTGLVAFQKRMRGFLRQIQLPTQGIAKAWEIAFDRWMHLSKEVSLATADGVDERMLSEWRNFSGLLASLGGICTYRYSSELEEAVGDLKWIDRVSSEHHEEPLLSRFLRLSIQLLGCNNIKVREAMREVLSTEVSPILYTPLFKALESELEVLLDGALTSIENGQENEIIFAEQAASLLKAMVEKLESPSDLGSVSSVHLGVLTLSFAKFLDGASDGVTTLRVKVKICQMCEAVTKRKEHLNLRDDVRIRNHLLEYIFGWIARPHALKQEQQRGNIGPRQDEIRRLQKDVDKACLRTLADLTLRLPLQPADSQSDAGMSELKSQMFHTYFNRFLSLLNYETQEIGGQELALAGSSRDEGPSNADLVITILSNLLSANIDVGLKHSLNIGYHENVDIRAAFVRVLCNILTQGTEFSSLTDAAVSDKYIELLNVDLELDPARLSTADELQKNAAQLQIVAKVFMDDICASASDVPSSFRRICSIISDAVLPRFPNAKYTAVGAFVFLRFFCPAIVAPEVEGLVPVAPTKEMRRGLLLIAKIIQNLANNILFGTKEPYMFPLNPFLVQNIHLVTGFLRDISVPPRQVDIAPPTDTFDFGSCISLHRFLYDHWDHLCQTLVSRGRNEYMRAPGEIVRTTPPVLESLRGLITNLGPPPLAISWNRPQISCNTPPLYSRFQNFMLRNAFKGAESFLTSRADGLSIVCVILRHIENESIDYETLLYCYLKIASRLWHEPFGLFIDATCYHGRSEPSDDFFSTLEFLTPSELSRNYSRIYIYNMNSAFKRCFRRLLRNATRDDSSVFHPNNVEYYLIGSLQDLHPHFHLSQLHLPKETISVVTEIRCIFQSITRLSKSKGKVDVVIKVGSQFVQITTVKKQEVLSGLRLSSVINDIFRLSEIEEASTHQAEDDCNFGLRADGGKIVMFFTSSTKTDVLQTIRGAKAKQGKDTRLVKPVERLVRPQDVPGTMLNLSLTNLSSPYHLLRLASYNLLGALCRSFDFGVAGRLVCNRDLAVPLEPSRFIVNISRELAQAEPQLTSDFLTEFFVSWDSVPEEQKPLSLEYVAPWLPGLRTAVLVVEVDGDKGRDKVATLLRKLIDIAVLDQNLTYCLEQHIWPCITQDELVLEIFIEELIKAGLGYGNRADTLEILSSVMVGLGTVTLRGRIISRLRKALNRSSLRPTRYLQDNSVWDEICILLQFCLGLSFDSRVQSQMFLPEIFHIVSMLANTGESEVRLLVYKLLINSIHAICVSLSVDDAKLTRLRSILDILGDPKGDIFTPPASLSRDVASVSTSFDPGPALTSTENLTSILFEVCLIAAPSVDIANAWRARWMSLVASTAFQNNPAVQPRAFAVMGYLAREEVDDDLLYQVLVALRNSVSQFGEDGNSEMLVSIITSLSRMMAKLPSNSRYGLQLFWLAMSIVRLVPAALFNCAAQFLKAILTNIGTIGNVRGDRMVPLLLQCRGQLEDAALPLDDAYGIRFEKDTFHFAVCACLVRGLTDTATRPIATQVLSSFLHMASDSADSGNSYRAVRGSPYLALLLARGMQEGNFMGSFWWPDFKPEAVSDIPGSRGMQSIENMTDQDLLLIAAIELVDFHSLEDATQARSLHWLNFLAEARPIVFTSLCGALPSILNDVLLHSQDSVALEAAHVLLQTLASEQKYTHAMGSLELLTSQLNKLGFGGLWKPPKHAITEDTRGECFELTEKLIELIVI